MEPEDKVPYTQNQTISNVSAIPTAIDNLSTNENKLSSLFFKHTKKIICLFLFIILALSIFVYWYAINDYIVFKVRIPGVVHPHSLLKDDNLSLNTNISEIEIRNNKLNFQDAKTVWVLLGKREDSEWWTTKDVSIKKPDNLSRANNEYLQKKEIVLQAKIVKVTEDKLYLSYEIENEPLSANKLKKFNELFGNKTKSAVKRTRVEVELGLSRSGRLHIRDISYGGVAFNNLLIGKKFRKDILFEKEIKIQQEYLKSVNSLINEIDSSYISSDFSIAKIDLLKFKNINTKHLKTTNHLWATISEKPENDFWELNSVNKDKKTADNSGLVLPVTVVKVDDLYKTATIDYGVKNYYIPAESREVLVNSLSDSLSSNNTGVIVVEVVFVLGIYPDEETKIIDVSIGGILLSDLISKRASGKQIKTTIVAKSYSDESSKYILPMQPVVVLENDSVSIVSFGDQIQASTILMQNQLPILITSQGPNIYSCATAACKQIKEAIPAFDIFDTRYALSSRPPPAVLSPKGELFLTFFGAQKEKTGLFVIHCKDIFCLSPDAGIISVSDAAGLTGLDPEIAIGGDGLPVVTYIDGKNQFKELHLILCADVSCATIKNNLTLDSKVEKGLVKVGKDGLPIVAYELFSDAGPIGLKTVKCQDVNCNKHSSNIHLGDNFALGFPDLAIGSDGYPIFVGTAVMSDKTQLLRALKCIDEICENAPQVVDLTSGPRNGFDSSIAIGKNGMPLIAHKGFPNATFSNYGDPALMFTYCVTLNCEKTKTGIIDNDKTAFIGENTYINIDDMGNPIITYWDRTNNKLRIAHCKTVTCGIK